MKIIIKIIFLFFIFASYYFMYWEGDWQTIDNLNCNNSVDNDKIISCIWKQWSEREIEDFICINWTLEEITYQIILDNKFKEIDLKVEKFIADLEKWKDIYFWKNKQYNFTQGLDLLAKKLWTNWEFYLEYEKLCQINWSWWIINDTMACLNWKSTITEVINQLDWWSLCYNMFQTKMAIYYDVANNILKNNKVKILKDNHKKFTQIQRKKYDRLIDMIMINIDAIEKIWSKWPSKTWTVHK